MTARLALCLEQTLGHRSHARNLMEALQRRATNAEVIDIDYSPPGRARVPWALRGSRVARNAIRSLVKDGAVDVVFYHTQSVSLFAPWTIDRPYVVSVDATPIQLDAMAASYAHRLGPRSIERAKSTWYRRVFAGAAAVVSWSCWAGDSLVRDYGVGADKIRVVHPGAPDYLFQIPRPRPPRKPRILFVGGDLDRKGGNQLLEAFSPLRDRAQLVLMTEAPLDPPVGVEVLHGVRPGTPEFLDAYASADIFCLPTLADCTPVAVGEALAAGLPVVASRIGSNAETVRDGKTGMLVTPGSVIELHKALDRLVDDADLRIAMGEEAREDARHRFSASANAGRVLEIVAEAGS